MGLDILQGVAEALVVTIPLIVVGAGGLLLLSRSRLGAAVAGRIAGDSRYSASQEQVDALQDELAALRNQLSETQERVDFAERLLSRADDTRRALSQGDPGATPR
jgi:peptidoglycan hydrolase CwlO-like protein